MCKYITSNINFHYKTNSEKTKDQTFWSIFPVLGVKIKLHDWRISACVYSNYVTLFFIISSRVRTDECSKSKTCWFRGSFVNIYTVLCLFYLIEYSKRFEIFTLLRRARIFISTLLSSLEIWVKKEKLTWQIWTKSLN